LSVGRRTRGVEKPGLERRKKLISARERAVGSLFRRKMEGKIQPSLHRCGILGKSQYSRGD